MSNKTDEIIKIGKSKRSVDEILDIDNNMRSTNQVTNWLAGEQNK